MPKKFDPNKKAKNACYSARGRCKNPNHKDYPNYGAKGVQFLFASLAEFVADVGLPESPEVSLDRIDPHGHYALGNVRWTSKAVQAVNKKGHSNGSTPTIPQAVHAAIKTAENGELASDATVALLLVIAAIRRGHFSYDDEAWFKGRAFRKKLFQWGWDFGQPPDRALLQSFFRLPSITVPGDVITLYGGPYYGNEGDPKRGTLHQLYEPSSPNIPDQVAQWLVQDRRSDRAGAVWLGQVTPQMLDRGGPEGWMLTAASILRHRPDNRITATFLPVRKVLERLAYIGGPWKWGEENDVLLDDEALFIPDLQVDHGAGFDIGPDAHARVLKLLQYRRGRGLKTFVGVQDHKKLPKSLAQELLGHFEARDLATLDWLEPHDLNVADWPASSKKQGVAAIADVVDLKG